MKCYGKNKGDVVMDKHNEIHLGHKTGAPGCDDQLPIHAHVGKGLTGNSFSVKVLEDSDSLTRLSGYVYDEPTKEEIEIWQSENINGGKLTSRITKNFSTVPATFKITFTYSRPSREEWVTETPAIPFIPEGPEPTSGADFATVFLKDHSAKTDDMWKEMTVIPEGHTREEFMLPDPPGGLDKLSKTQPKDKGGDWSGALDVVELDEFVKLSGLSREKLLQIVQGVSNVIISPVRPEIQANNIIDYIDKLTCPFATSQDIKDIFK